VWVLSSVLYDSNDRAKVNRDAPETAISARTFPGTLENGVDKRERRTRGARRIFFGKMISANSASSAFPFRDPRSSISPTYPPRIRSPTNSGYFVAMVGFTQPFFMIPCDGRKLR
jgi:hypothetical protein